MSAKPQARKWRCGGLWQPLGLTGRETTGEAIGAATLEAAGAAAMKVKCPCTTEHRAAKVVANNHLRSGLFAGRGRWRPAVQNLCWSVGQSLAL